MTPQKRIVGTIVQTTYAGAAKSLLVDFEVDARETFSSKLLDRKPDRFSCGCKSSVSHSLSRGIATPQQKELRLVEVSEIAHC
jgi:hypothetical protein